MNILLFTVLYSTWFSLPVNDTFLAGSFPSHKGCER